ncbi:MAG TPA: GNAT family N-acetyltransferase [Candidatus Baltobacteraceae bacterium]|nr:GNAT family N-acetyltransferase [Candidatus Baltobacteraceae bacterium]
MYDTEERTLAWIDDEFGGSWSSEAFVGGNVVARDDAGAPIGFATYDPQGLRFRWLRGLAKEPGVGIFGPIGVTEGERRNGLGTELLLAALGKLRERGYSRALIAAVGEKETIDWYRHAAKAEIAERYDAAALAPRRPRVSVMVSGSGTNLQSVLDRSRSGELPIDVVAVVSNCGKAYALERARNAGVSSVRVVTWKRKEEARDAYDLRLLEEVRADNPDLVLMLGWMHLLSEPFVRAFPSLLNLHPAFLPLDPARDDVVLPDGTTMPAYRGPDAAGDALREGRRWVGATVHAVTPATDRGPVIARKPLRVDAHESHEDVMQRLHPVEHALVATAIRRWIYERP